MRKKILILNLVPNTVGDSIIMMPMFKIIKKNYPKSFLLVTSDSLSKELWKKDKNIDELMVVEELKILGDRNTNKVKKFKTYVDMLFKLSRKLKKHDLDTCFIAYPNFFLMPLIPYFSGINERIGFTYKDNIFSFLLTKKVPSKGLFDGYYRRHIIEAFLDLLRAENLEFSEKDTHYEINYDKQELNKVKKKLKKKGISTKKKIFSLHTMSKLDVKNWPKKRYIKVVKKILEEKNTVVMLHGSKKEHSYNEEIRKVNENRIFNLCGEFSLREVGAALKSSDVFIGNDSGLAHYASAVGTKTLVLFGASNPEHAKPLGIGKTKVIFKTKPENTYNYMHGEGKKDFENMKKISVSDVIKEIRKFE